MSTEYDVIIAGVGAMGSAAACHLARRGVCVLGLDRFSPPHDRGSSHGQTRIIREAYFEHPVYVPMVQRAYQLWRELEQAAGTPLLLETGGLMIGLPDSVVVTGAQHSAKLHGLRHELLTAHQVNERFPALRLENDMVAVWEPRAGVLFPERCIAAHLAQARAAGASFRFDDPVVSWEPEADGVRVVTATAEYSARQLILSAGAWAGSLLPQLEAPLQVERQVQFWFEPDTDPAAFSPERCPVHLWQFDDPDNQKFFYGFPQLGDGVKVAFHHDGQQTDAENVRRDVTPAEIEAMRAVVRRFLPGADGVLRATAVCLYANTPDEHFWIDRHPRCPQVLIASPCSGHGFKFSAAIGEILADMAQGKAPRFDLGLFRTRPGARPPSGALEGFSSTPET